jgi:hypothetical protein
MKRASSLEKRDEEEGSSDGIKGLDEVEEVEEEEEGSIADVCG